MALLYTSGRRDCVVFTGPASIPPSGSVFTNKQNASAPVFPEPLVVVIEVPVVPPEALPPEVFGGPPDFILLEALRPDDVEYGDWPDSSTLPQRVIKLLLDGGSLYYSQNPASLRRALPFLEESEHSKLISMLANQPPEILHQFPKRIAKAPVLAVRAGKEDVAVDEKLISDYAGQGQDGYGDFDGGTVDLFSVGFDSHVTVGIYSENADVTIFWYEMAKFVLMQTRLVLAKLGIDNLSLRGGDINPLSRYLPEDVYIRELVVRCRTRQIYARDSGLVTLLNTVLKVD